MLLICLCIIVFSSKSIFSQFHLISSNLTSSGHTVEAHESVEALRRSSHDSGEAEGHEPSLPAHHRVPTGVG